MISFLQTGQLKIREVKYFVQGHTANMSLKSQILIALPFQTEKSKTNKNKTNFYHKATDRLGAEESEASEASSWFCMLSYNFHFVVPWCFHHGTFSFGSVANSSMSSMSGHRSLANLWLALIWSDTLPLVKLLRIMFVVVQSPSHVWLFVTP